MKMMTGHNAQAAFLDGWAIDMFGVALTAPSCDFDPDATNLKENITTHSPLILTRFSRLTRAEEGNSHK